jgi:hypothetical protein
MNYSADFVFAFYAVIFFAFLLVSVVVGLLIFILSKVLHKSTSQDSELRIPKALLIGIVVTGIAGVVFYVIPSMIKDSNWRSKQEICAKEAGYASPGDDNTNKATAESQDIYRKCILDEK